MPRLCFRLSFRLSLRLCQCQRYFTDCESTTNFGLCNFLCNRFHSFLFESEEKENFMVKWLQTRAESAIYYSPTQSERSERHVGEESQRKMAR